MKVQGPIMKQLTTQDEVAPRLRGLCNQGVMGRGAPSFARSPRCLMVLCTLLLVAGCAPAEPKRTAGTANLAPDQLAILHVRPHHVMTAWKGQPVHVESFFIEEGQYAVADDQEYYILPGKQTFTIEYGPCLHGWAKVEAPFNADTGVFEGPYGRFEATLVAGKYYEIVGSSKLVGKNAVQTEHRLIEAQPPAKPK